MKISIVGCGNQGAGLAGLLCMEDDVETIVLADFNPEMVSITQQFINQLGDRVKVKNIISKQVDAMDSDDVAHVIEGTDLAFNGIIPKCNIPIMQACIEKGVHYLDLFGLPFECDGVDKNETIGAQFELDDDFKERGIIAVPSVGMSPGWTSLAVEHMMKTMDSIDEIIIRWADWLDTDVFIAPIAPIVIFHEWFGPPYPISMQNGAIKEVDLVTSQEAFEFPDPIGTQQIYTVTAHADIVLIDKFLPKPISRIEEKGGIILGNTEMKDVWLTAIREQTAKHPGKEHLDMLETFADSFILPIQFKEYYDKGLIRDAVLSFTVECRGKSQGQDISHTCYYTSTLEEAMRHLPWASHSVYGTIAGVPIELLLRICRGEITNRGVVNLPDLGISDDLMKAISARGQILTEKIVRSI